MNLAVAAWWIAQPSSVAVPPIALPEGVARLQLLGERGATTVAATTAQQRDDQRCVRFGPFADDALLAHARQVLVALADGAGVKQLQTSPPAQDIWRVVMPPLADVEQARETARRIDAAGFSDYLVIGDGAEANSIALGQYSSEDAARKHQSALAEAGFQSQVHREGGTTRYLAIALSSSTDVAGLRIEIAALRAVPMDCSALQ